MTEPSDAVVRALTEDGSFRIIALDTTQTVRDATAAQKVSGDRARLFGELLTGAVLIRETMAPSLRVQVILRDADAANIVADSHPGGMTRGLLNVDDDQPDAFGGENQLQVMRVLPRGDFHQGVIAIQGADEISDALTTYMLTSEQVTSFIGVSCTVDSAGVQRAGGFIVQLLPEATRETLALLTAHLDALPPTRHLLRMVDGAPLRVIERVMAPFPYAVLQTSPLRFGCNCSEVRVLSAIATIGRDEIAQIVAEGRTLQIDCDYCGTHYAIGVEQLRSFLHET